MSVSASYGSALPGTASGYDVATLLARIVSAMGWGTATAAQNLRAYQCMTIAGRAASTWNGTDWWWLRATGTFFTEADVASYDLRTANYGALPDLWAVNRAYCEDTWTLKPMAYEAYRELYVVGFLGETTAKPGGYVQTGEPPRIHLGPTPDDVYLIHVDYTRRHPRITAEAADTAFIVPGEYQGGVYVEGALWLLRHDIADVASLKDCEPFAKTMGRMNAARPEEYDVRVVQPVRRTGAPSVVVPNMIYKSVISTADEDILTAVWEQILDFGANCLPLGGHAYMARRPFSAQSDDDYLNNYLTVKAALGYPVQMQADFGYHAAWHGDNAAPVIFRRTDEEMFDDDHVEVYHTTIQDAITTNMKDLVDANVPGASDDYAQAVRYLHCPGYRGSRYMAALEKLEEAAKWYQPILAYFDNEFYTNANMADYYTALVAGLEKNWSNPPYNALKGCSRCVDEDGYVANVNQVGKDIASRVRMHVPDALVTQFHVFDYSTSPYSRYKASYWDFGTTTGFTTPLFSLYQLTYDPDTAVGSRTLFTDPIARYEDLMAIGQDAGRQFWPGTITNAFVSLSHRMDVYDSTAGYMTNGQMYDLCVYLLGEGAKGFALSPGYSGKDKDPTTYVVGDNYTAEQIADDAAAIRLLPVMHQAMRDIRGI